MFARVVHPYIVEIKKSVAQRKKDKAKLCITQLDKK